jgi:hypothetical protein
VPCRTETLEGQKAVVVSVAKTRGIASESIVRNVLTELEANDCSRVLYDFSDTVGRVSPMGVYALMAALEKAGLYGTRIAVANGLDSAARELCEMMAANRGFDVGCHERRAAAVRWLTRT